MPDDFVKPTFVDVLFKMSYFVKKFRNKFATETLHTRMRAPNPTKNPLQSRDGDIAYAPIPEKKCLCLPIQPFVKTMF